MKVEKTGGGPGGTGKAGSSGVSGGSAAAGSGATAKVHESSFASALSGVVMHEVEGDLRQVIGRLDAAALVLRQDPSVANLGEYKSLVRGFMQRVVDKLYIVEEKDSTRLSQQGNIKVNLKRIDDELEKLTEDILNRSDQRDAMTIADRLDGIRGLLLDLLS